MRTKIYAVVGTIGTLLSALPAKAASLLTVPTSTVTDLTANVSDTLSDTGLLGVIVAAIAFSLVFWVIHRVIGLFPKGR